jgi:hypothetical protein
MAGQRAPQRAPRGSTGSLGQERHGLPRVPSPTATRPGLVAVESGDLGAARAAGVAGAGVEQRVRAGERVRTREVGSVRTYPAEKGPRRRGPDD